MQVGSEYDASNSRQETPTLNFQSSCEFGASGGGRWWNLRGMCVHCTLISVNKLYLRVWYFTETRLFEFVCLSVGPTLQVLCCAWGQSYGWEGKFECGKIQNCDCAVVAWYIYKLLKLLCVWCSERELFYLTTLAIAELCSANERQMIYEYWTVVEWAGDNLLSYQSDSATSIKFLQHKYES
jgi:hypothetical protein